MEPFNSYQDLADRLQKMDEKLSNKLDVLNERIASMDKTQVEIKKDLQYHIARTDILEDQVLVVRKQNQEEIDLLKKRVEPIETIRFTWINIIKLVVFISAIVGAVAAVLEAIK